MNMTRYILVVAVAAVAACTGCMPRKAPDPALFVKPTIAVMKFENRAPFPLAWDLGDGMADVLVDRLVASRRYHVIERAELDSVLREHRFQASGATRKEARAVLGRIKNVSYLVKGTVTDFGHVSTAKGFVSGASLGLVGSSAAAIMGMTFYVVDVESGEIIFSDHLEKAVGASGTAVRGSYEGVAMGGSVFFRTPLGKATAEVMDIAVRKITKRIASHRWWPKIADIADDGQFILNGGRNRRIVSGYMYDVLEQGRKIVDPETGDVIGRLQPTILARIRVTKVLNRFCEAELVQGDALQVKAGLICRPYGQPQPTIAPAGQRRKRRTAPAHRRH